MDLEKAKELSPLLKKFYRGEPLALGITQILTGIIGIAFGAVLNLAYDHKFRFYYVIALAPYWTGALYIISGSLAVAAARNPKTPLMKVMVSMNVVSAVGASLAILLFSISMLSERRYAVNWCSNYGLREVDQQCYEAQVIPHDIMIAVMSVLLLFTLLAFCISISNAVFGSKTLCRDPSTKMIVVVYQGTPLHNDVSLPVTCEDAKNP
ncbi:membrane-spanning 4-domains subfamily A member 4A-like [Tiliqua scincoides]|uniref:membrane-spanning 4-domains subfamily A member 4A-like n=1 Tax=Tiliqua scincoides TaxID=71010 RepID=UPI003461B58F